MIICKCKLRSLKELLMQFLNEEDKELIENSFYNSQDSIKIALSAYADRDYMVIEDRMITFPKNWIIRFNNGMLVSTADFIQNYDILKNETL